MAEGIRERVKKLLDMLESLLSITEQFTEGEIQFDHEAMKEWHRISAETADIRDGEQITRHNIKRKDDGDLN